MQKDIVTVYKATFKDKETSKLLPYFKILISETKGDLISVNSFSTTQEVYTAFQNKKLPLNSVEVDFEVKKFGDKTMVKVVGVRA